MRGKETHLRILQRNLSGRGKRVFPNQVVFYNAVFAATNPLLMPAELVADLERAGDSRGTALEEPLVKQVKYLLRHGLDSNSANVGKHINGVPGFRIPKQHKAHYLDNANRGEILRRLRAVIYFCLAYRPAEDAMDRQDLDSLLAGLRRSLSDASDTLCRADECSPGILANAIYEVLQTCFSQVQENLYPLAGSVPPRMVDMAGQRAEYMEKVDCFGKYNIDRFFALRRLAESNVIAANDLACVYYYGTEYLGVEEGEGNNGHFRVKRDYTLAAHYFKIAAECDPPITSACWSLGFMILNRKFPDVAEEDAEVLAERYFKYAASQDYNPAYNNLGLIELARADRLLKRYPDLDGEEQEAMLEHYRRGLELCDKAGCRGWPYGHINIANFLMGGQYQALILPRLHGRLSLEGPMNLMERWKCAADMDNLWAINCLALLECDMGHPDSALTLWKRAAAYQYPTASLNMALRLYSPEGLCPDPADFRRCLEQASEEGSARASFELARQHHRTPLTAKGYLSRAEEQNYEEFNNRLYHQIQDLRTKLNDG